MTKLCRIAFAWMAAAVVVPGVAIAQIALDGHLTATPDYTLPGWPVLLQVQFVTLYERVPVSGGTVDFTDGRPGPVLCAGVPVVAGSAQCTASFATPGVHYAQADYSGDPAYALGGAGVKVVIDSLLTPNASMQRSSLISTLGDPVTFTAQLTGNAGDVTGEVDFIDGTTPVCTRVPVVGGAASCTTTSLGVGDHFVYGLYGGGGWYRATPIDVSLHTVVNVPRAGETNVALATAGGRVSGSPPYLQAGFSVSSLIDGDPSGLHYGTGTGMYCFIPCWAQVDFDGPKSIDKVVLYAPYKIGNPEVPSDTTYYGQNSMYYDLGNFDVEAWDGNAWVTVARVSNNPFLKRTVAFAPIVTTSVRAVFRGWFGWTTVHLVEFEAYGTEAGTAQFNVALASTGTVASASSQLNADYPVTAINNGVPAGDRPGGEWWADGTPGQWPDWVQLDFNGPQTLQRVVVRTVQDDVESAATPADSATFTRYGITDFTVDAWDGTKWVPLGTVTANNLVRRSVEFAPFTTSRIRINVLAAADTVSRVAEVEAWGVPAAPARPEINWALASNGPHGVVATASSQLNVDYPVGAVIDGDAGSRAWNQGGGWADLTIDQWPDWVQLNFPIARTIDHVVVYTVPDQWGNAEHRADDATTFSLYGIVDFDVMGWNGAQWVLLGSVHDNNFVKRNVPFAPFTTDRIRIVVNRGLYYVSRITEVQAWGP